LFLNRNDPYLETIVYKIRLPRILGAILVGAGLAVAGASLQSILRNPLAEPYTLGISGGASLGVTLAVLFNLPRLGFPLAGFLGALFAIMFIYSISSKRNFSASSLILSGVVLNFLFASTVLFLFALARPEQVQGILFWLMGDLSQVGLPNLKVVSLFIVPTILISIFFGPELDILSLGEEKAHYLGLNTIRSKKMFFLFASLITGVAISCSGLIGFVGLLIPHLMRRFVSFRHRLVLPASALAGAVFLLVSDTLARKIISPLELPVGVITGLVGGIFFLGILMKVGEWKID
jgi:iron complex transport system permease protein